MIKKLVAVVLPVTVLAAGIATILEKDVHSKRNLATASSAGLVPVDYEPAQASYTLTQQDADFLNGLAEVLDPDTLAWLGRSDIDAMDAMQSAKAACGNLNNGQPVMEVIQESATWVEAQPTSEQIYAARYAFSLDALGIGSYCPAFYADYTATFEALASNSVQEQ